MTTHKVSMLRKPTPDGTGNCFCAPYDAYATNDLWKHDVFVFKDSAVKEGFYDTFEVPANFVSTARVIVVWTAIATTNNIVMELDYRCVAADDTNSLDQATAAETPSTTDAAPGAVNRRMETTITLTDANVAAGATMEYFINRLCSSASDTMVGDVLMHDLLFSYSDV